MRRLDSYIRKYGPVFGPKLYHALQSQAAHAGVSARLRRKLDSLTGRPRSAEAVVEEALPLFPDLEAGSEAEPSVAGTFSSQASKPASY